MRTVSFHERRMWATASVVCWLVLSVLMFGHDDGLSGLARALPGGRLLIGAVLLLAVSALIVAIISFFMIWPYFLLAMPEVAIGGLLAASLMIVVGSIGGLFIGVMLLGFYTYAKTAWRMWFRPYEFDLDGIE